MSDNSLIVERPRDGVALLTLNRPAAYNALTTPLYAGLCETVLDLAGGEDIRAIVLTGAGEKAFSAGYDVKEMLDFTPDQQLLDYYRRDQWMLKIASCRVAVIAAINGLAYGGGANLAIACDIRVGSARSTFKIPAAAYAGVNSTWSLPHIVGHGIAKEWLMTGREISAEEAFRRGLLNHLVEPEAVLGKALEIAGTIAGHPAVGPRAVKALVDGNIGRHRADALRAETSQLITEQPPKPVKQVFEAFLDRRK